MKSLFLIFAMLAVLSSCKEEDKPEESSNPFMVAEGSPPLIVAHGGAKQLNPENTMHAFDYAVAANCDVLEMDVAITKDSVLVTIHDLTIDDTSDSTGRVVDYTFDELQQFNFGYDFRALDGTFPYRNVQVRIPSVSDIIMKHPGEYMMIEIKDDGPNGKLAAEILYQILLEHNMIKKAIVFSFSDEVMNHFDSINDEDILTGATLVDGFAFYGAVEANPDTVLQVRSDVFAIPASYTVGSTQFILDSQALIDAAHRNNVGVHYWTINDKDKMKELINKGVDGIITDRPDLMKEALAELGF